MVTTTAIKINVIANSILVAFLLVVSGVAIWLTYNHIMTPAPVSIDDGNIHGLLIVVGAFVSLVFVIASVWFIVKLFDSIQDYYESKTMKGVWDD